MQRSMTGTFLDDYAHWKEDVMNVWGECPHPITAGEECEPVQRVVELAAKYPENLIFTTTVARLRLKQHRQWEDRTVIDICDQDMKSVGRMMKAYNEWTEKWLDLNKEHDFAVICATVVPISRRRGPMRDNDLWDESPEREREYNRYYPGMTKINPWMLRVMLIERDSEEPMVCRRLAVGSIEVRCWQHCDPRWETIVLV